MDKERLDGLSFPRDSAAQEMLEKYVREINLKEKFSLGLRLFEHLQSQGQIEMASRFLEKLEAGAYSPEQENVLLIKRGDHLIRQSRYEEAAVCLEKAVVALSSQPDSLNLFQAYRNLAWLYFRQGYLERARSFTDGAGLVIEMRSPRRDRETREAQAALFHILGLIESSGGDHQKAIGYYDQETEIWEELGETSRLGSVYNNLSGIYRNAGRLDRAMDYQNKSYQLAESSGEQLSLAISCNNLGEIHFALGQYSKAEEYFKRYLEINSRIGNQVGNAFGRAGLGRICQAKGEYREAGEHYTEALRIAEMVKSPGKESSILAEMTQLFLDQGYIDRAMQCLDRAIALSLAIERFSTHRHRLLNAKIILARALAEGANRAGLEEARNLLAELTQSPLVIEDEEAVSATELETDAWFALSRAEYSLGNRDRAREHLAKASKIIEATAELLDPECREGFLNRKDIAQIKDWGKRIGS